VSDQKLADAQHAPGNQGDDKPGAAAGPPKGKQRSLQDIASESTSDHLGSATLDPRG